MSSQIVVGFALAWCAVRLIGYAMAARRFRLPGASMPDGFIRRAIIVTVLACGLCVLIVGTHRPFALAGAVLAFCLLGAEIVRAAAPRAG